jgi:putative transposase
MAGGRQGISENPFKVSSSPRIPKYKDKVKGRNILVYSVQALSKPGLRLGLIVPSKTNLSIPTKQQQIRQVRIITKLDHYVVEVIYERQPIQQDVSGERIASIDLGVDNLAAITSNYKGFRPILVSGRHIKSVNQYYNKRKAQLQSKLKGNQKTTRADSEII